MDWFSQLAEEKIRAAVARGELDNLEGSGQPIDLDRYEKIPADLRASYTLLSNHGFLPDAVEAHQDCMSLQALLDAATSTGDAPTPRTDELRRDLRRAQLRYSMLLERRGHSLALTEYRDTLLAPRAADDHSDTTR